MLLFIPKAHLTPRASKEVAFSYDHFRYLKPQHKILRRKKAERKTPHFLSLNQDIVAWSQ